MWFHLCDNARAFQALYASAGGLDRVRLFEVVLGAHARRLRLCVELARFPDHPPARWSPHANAVQVTVDFWWVQGLRIEGWEDTPAGLLSLTREDQGLRVAFDSAEARITARCASARIDRFSAYTDEPTFP